MKRLTLLQWLIIFIVAMTALGVFYAGYETGLRSANKAIQRMNERVERESRTYPNWNTGEGIIKP